VWRGDDVLLNRVILIGRLTRDPELKYIPSGTPVASFTLAVDRPFLNKDGERETDFIPIVVWRKQAENCANYLGKGSLVAVDGRMQVRSYEQDGQRRYVTEVVADSVRFLDRRGDPSARTVDSGFEQYGTDAGPDDDIPF